MAFASRRTLSMSLSNGNSGECTPITTNPLSLYFSAQARTYGSVRSQLTHVYVQTSTRTIFPRSPAAVSGSELSHPVARLREDNSPVCDGAAASFVSGVMLLPPAKARIGAPIALMSVAATRSWFAFMLCTRRLREQLHRTASLRSG